MNIKTITCHDVYNAGAGLQAYALCTYLRSCGHDAEIIDYKPDYLSRHYSLSWVNNPRFDKPLVRELFLLAKLPTRLKARHSGRKKRFDTFRDTYLPLTKRYDRFDALKTDPPKADVYIAGSDQIWNPLFPNGKDPAFFLDFAPEGARRVSYAASFAVETLSEEDKLRMTPWLKALDDISVREQSGVALLQQMGIDGTRVMDPVFLLEREAWEALAVPPSEESYVLVYDFENSTSVRDMALALKERTGKPIVSVFSCDYADKVWQDMGPLEFLGAVRHAETVLSNSFHATAFSLIFQKEFYVVRRREGINTRMSDLLDCVELTDRLVSALPSNTAPIDWVRTQTLLEQAIAVGRQFLHRQITP